MDEGLTTKPLFIRFGTFELDLHTAQLRSAGVLTKLQPQPAKVLGLLASNPGVLITREQICRHVWGDDTFVDFEHALNFCIRQIREALGDDPKSPRFIETLPRRGYRFVGMPDIVAPAPAPAPASVLRIGVMPFRCLGREDEPDYLGEGLTEELMRLLSRLAPGRLRVIARTTMMRCRREDMALDRLRRELGLDFLLDGSVRRSPDGARIAVELVDVKEQTLVWAEAYERSFTDLYGIQSDVAIRVARSLAVELLPAGAGLAPRTSTNSQAHEAYLKGRYFFNRLTADSVAASIRYFEEAIAADPNYALAYAGLSDCYAQMGSIRVALLPPADALAKAKPMAVRALELDDELPEAHNALALVKCWYELDWAGAGEEFRRALALNPDNVTHAPWHAAYLVGVGQPERALAEIYRAREIDPLSPIINAYVGAMQFWAGQPDLSIQQLREAISLDPSFYAPYFFLGETLMRIGRHAEALSTLAEAHALSPRSLLVIAMTGTVYAEMGDHQSARAMLKRLFDTAGKNFDPGLFASIIHAALGEIDVAFELIERAIERRFNPIYILRCLPLDPLYDDPRYTSCLRRIGLPPSPALPTRRR
jgi:TolB-like protein/Flp pilus assembly protein TadD